MLNSKSTKLYNTAYFFFTDKGRIEVIFGGGETTRFICQPVRAVLPVPSCNNVALPYFTFGYLPSPRNIKILIKNRRRLRYRS